MTRLSMVLVAGLALSGCATQVTNTSAIAPIVAPTMVRPQRVVVVGFTADADRVGLDSGVAARINRQNGNTRPARERAVLAQSVRSAIVQELLTDLSQMGFSAVDAGASERPRPGDLLIRGVVQKIDQGNRTRRLAVGLGVGKSEVTASAEMSYVGADGVPQLLQTYNAASNSGRMPGMAVGVASSAAQDVVAPAVVSAALGARREVKKTGVAGEGQKLAHRLSYEMGQYFVAQQWIEASRAPSGGLIP